MTPEYDEGLPTHGKPSTDSSRRQATESEHESKALKPGHVVLREQYARRRYAAWRLPPLECGRRDPAHNRAGDGRA